MPDEWSEKKKNNFANDSRPLHNQANPSILSYRRRRLCHNSKRAINSVMPMKIGIQTSSRRKSGTSSKLLDSPVSSTGQDLRRASLEYNPAYAGRNNETLICDTVSKAGIQYWNQIFWFPTFETVSRPLHNSLDYQYALPVIYP